MLTIVPSVVRGPVGTTLAQALRPAGWLLLVAGALLLGIHFILRRADTTRNTGVTQAEATLSPRRPTRGLVDKVSKEPATDSVRVSSMTSRQSTHRPEASWSSAVLAAIEWRRFEALCEAFYAQSGLTTRSQSHGADGGVDIWLQSKHMDAPRIVQCKHWQNRAVGVKEMREFRGVMASHRLESGTYVTSSTFTTDATAFAKANGILLQDGAALLKLIGQRTSEQQAALLAVAYEGEYWRPTCASCGTKMVERTSGNAVARGFWGCANYPRCRGKTSAKAREAMA
jgi:restriction system protein